MIKLLLLSLTSLTAVLADSRRRQDCATCPTGTGYFRENNLLGRRFKDDVKKLCSDKDCDSGFDSSMSDDRCHDKKRRHHRRCDDSCSSYGSDSCSDSCSSSSACSSSSDPCPPRPVPRDCDVELRTPLRSMEERLFQFLKNFENQYRNLVIVVLSELRATVAALVPAVPTPDFTALLTALEAAGITVPANLVTELQALVAGEVSIIVKTIQDSLIKVIDDLIARISVMCYIDIVGLVNSGLLLSQLTSALNNATPQILAAMSDLLNKELALIQSILGPLPPAVIATITPILQDILTPVINALTAQVNQLTTDLQQAVAQLITQLQALVNSSAQQFVTLANAEIAAIVSRIFGIPVPTPSVASSS